MRFLPFSSASLNFVTLAVLPISTALLYQQYSTRIMAPKLAAIRTANEDRIAGLAGAPVAVFVGGTSGIGRGMAEVYVKHRGGKPGHVVIVGRNERAAKEIFAGFPSPGEGWSFEFVQCDATLMSNVHRAAGDILAKYPKINLLVMSPGFFAASGRDETPEGIDKKLAVHYYARWKFTKELAPALVKAREDGEEARVLSVLAAGHGGPIDVEDLGLKKGYSVSAAATGAVTYTDYMIESFAERYPTLTFTHAYPGIVLTNLMSSARTAWMRAISPIVMPLVRPFAVSIHECGEYMWAGLLRGDGEGGAWRFGSKGEVIPGVQYSGDEEVRKRVWAHTEEVTAVEA